MKFSREILIDLPREEVIRKMEDPSNYKHWQRGFISYKHLSGLPGKEGSRARIKFNMNGREIVIIETIMKINSPKKFYATYETKGVFNTQKNHFEKVADNFTRWITDSEFKFTGYMKLVGLLKPGIFKKQTQQMMQDFKDFAEKNKSVLDQ